MWAQPSSTGFAPFTFSFVFVFVFAADRRQVDGSDLGGVQLCGSSSSTREAGRLCTRSRTQVTGVRVLAELVLHDGHQVVDGLPHVDRCRADEDAD
jgi:hypothetical protein